jgi:hypothetical protein
VSDNANEETLGSWGRVTKHYLIRLRIMTKPHSGWQNRREDEIRGIRKQFARVIMTIHICPDAFRDYAMKYVERQLLVRTAATDRTPIESITGDTPDTSEYIDFDFYQWVKYREQTEKDEPIKLGRWLGIAHDVGSSLTRTGY